MLVIYPEGGIFRDNQVHRLKPGLARIALQAQCQSSRRVKILPVSLRYDPSCPRWRSQVNVAIGKPLDVLSYLSSSQQKTLTAEELKLTARTLTDDLSEEMSVLSKAQTVATVA
jgi:1-acyl-sn-glycerol-3-phosphate acyltransferase